MSKSKHYLFIPDIDKWSRFSRSIKDLVEASDISFLDASFYSMEEMSHRNLAEIPHPLVVETMELFKEAQWEPKTKSGSYISIIRTDSYGMKKVSGN